MPLRPPRSKHPFDRLVAVMAALRSKRGCPWDRKQTHQSLKPYLLEEAYEAFEAIDAKDAQKLKGELGDVLLQVVFHSQLAAEKKQFTIDDVASAIADKMVVRHPHVFGSAKVKGAAEQTLRWEAIKSKEKEHQKRKSMVDGVPKAMPALARAQRVLSKAARATPAWDVKRIAWQKLEEELKEFKQAVRSRSKKHKEEELGDLLLMCASVARHEGLDAEHCLHAGVRKVCRRFERAEMKARKRGMEMEKMGARELVGLWEEVKKEERSPY